MPSERAVFRPLPLGSVTACGWTREMIERTREGLGGHFGELDPDQFEKPYQTRDFNAFLRGDREKVGWCGEMAAEYRLGQLMIADTLGDAAFRKRYERWRDAAFRLQDAEPGGYLGAYRPGDDRGEDYNAFNAFYAYRAFLLDYSKTRDARILDALHRGALWFVNEWKWTPKTMYAAPSVIWPMVEIYRLTGDRRLLAFAEGFAKWLDDNPDWVPHKGSELKDKTGGFTAFSIADGDYHVGAYANRAVLPAMLWLANGDEKLLKASCAAFWDHHDKVGWQVSGTPCSRYEHTWRPGCTGESEYCNFLLWMEWMQQLVRCTGDMRYGDLIERMTFNGAMGGRSKKEHSVAYMTAPNQLFATKTSCRQGGMPYMGAYAGCVYPACCMAQSIRLMPSYLAGSVFTDGKGNLVFNTYAPYRVKHGEVEVELETLYPFEETIRLHVKSSRGWSGGLRLRRPGWAKGWEVQRNGKACDFESGKGWLALAGPWKDDLVSIRFVFDPVVRPVRESGRSDEPLRAVEYGPLVFSQPFKEKWTAVPPEPPARPQTIDWPWWDVTCDEKPVFYAMPPSTALGAKGVRVVRKTPKGYVWENPPLCLSVPMVRAGKAYPPGSDSVGFTRVPNNPVPMDAGAEIEDLELIPFGCTVLRLTCFPIGIGQ